MKSRSKHNIFNFFEGWIQENNKFFNVPLIRAPYKKGKVWYFSGISKDLLTLQVDDGGIVVWAWHDGKPVDMILDLDAVLDYKSGSGYYCSMRIKPVYYQSVYEFYYYSCFERLKEWINLRLSNSKFILVCYYGDRAGVSTAHLNFDLKKKKQFFARLRTLLLLKKSDIEIVRIDLWK